MPAVSVPTCTLPTGQSDTVLTTWFERDRAHVCLSRKDRDGEPGETIHEWWDDAVSQAVDDGFLNPRDWHGAAFAYASHLGMIKPVRIDLKESWPIFLKTFLEKTPSKERPRQQPDRLEWYAGMARETAETITGDLQFASLSAGQVDSLVDRLTDELYEMALLAEESHPTLSIAASGGVVEIGTDGEKMILRGGAAATKHPFHFGSQTATFTLTWLHSDGLQSGELTAMFERSDSPQPRQDKPLAEKLKASLLGLAEKHAGEIDHLILQTREWNAFIELEQALDRAVWSGTPGSAEAQELAYDAARAATLLGQEADPAPAPAI
jgi:hypothetical protein